eukprot:scaffold49726_cov27-Tisochrysis_lutea.AAC.3
MQQEIAQLKEYIERLAGGPAFPASAIVDADSKLPPGAPVAGSGIASVKALSRSASRAPVARAA